MSILAPNELKDNYDAWRASVDGTRLKKSGDCFIATACYQDQNAPEILVLREWRDVVLSRHTAGRAFIYVYYRIGPYLAYGLKRHPALLGFVRRRLDSHVRKIKARMRPTNKISTAT